LSPRCTDTLTADSDIPERAGRLAHAQPFELHQLNGLSCFARETRQKALQVECALDPGEVILSHQLFCRLDRHVSCRGFHSTQVVQKLVASDGIRPWREELRLIVGVPVRVDSYQSFLHQILGLCRGAAGAGQPSLEVSAQVTAQNRQQRLVRGRIAIKACDHEGS